MEWTVVWEIVKRFWWVLPVVAAVWFAYDWAYDRGHDSRNAEVTALKADAKKWHDAYDAQAKTIANENKAHEEAVTALKKDQEKIVSILSDRLTTAEKKAAQVKVVTKDVVRFVSKETDARYPVPIGLARLHDSALGVEGTAEAFAIPGSGQTDDAAPSRIEASVLGAIVRDNYAECTARGEVIKAWQEWYPKMKEAWGQAVKTQSNFEVVKP